MTAGGFTISGTGRIRTRLINAGLIEADLTGRVLDVRVTNTGTIQARSGGILRFSGGQAGHGAVIVADALSRVDWYGGVRGGLAINEAGGTSVFHGYCELQNATLIGSHLFEAGADVEFYWAGSFNNNGTLTFEAASTGEATRLNAWWPARIDGAGLMILDAEPTDASRIIVGTGDEAELTFGPEQTLAGNATFEGFIRNEGRLSPGQTADEPGIFDLTSSNWTQAPSAELLVDLAGTQVGQYDRLFGLSQIVLDGALVVRLAGTFAPQIGDEFTILTFSQASGDFARIEAPPVDGAAWRLRRAAHNIVLTLTCPTDIDGDHQTNLADLTILLAHFGAAAGAGQAGDVDGDGFVGLVDLALLLAQFGSACGS